MRSVGCGSVEDGGKAAGGPAGRCPQRRLEEAHSVAGRIAQPCFAPEPWLIGGRLLELDAQRGQPTHFPVEIRALEVHHRRRPPALRIRLLDRERTLAVWALEPCIARERV